MNVLHLARCVGAGVGAEVGDGIGIGFTNGGKSGVCGCTGLGMARVGAGVGAAVGARSQQVTVSVKLVPCTHNSCLFSQLNENQDIKKSGA